MSLYDSLYPILRPQRPGPPIGSYRGGDDAMMPAIRRFLGRLFRRPSAVPPLRRQGEAVCRERIQAARATLAAADAELAALLSRPTVVLDRGGFYAKAVSEESTAGFIYRFPNAAQRDAWVASSPATRRAVAPQEFGRRRNGGLPK